MNMKSKYILSVLAATLFIPVVGNAQNLRFDEDASKSTYIMPIKDTVTVGFDNDMVSVPVMSNCDYTVSAPEVDWLKCVKEQNGNLTLISSYWYEALESRYATINLTSADGSYTRALVVRQAPNTSANEIQGDTKLAIASATANSTESGQGIARTYDDDYSTLWHSAYSGGNYPFILTYTLSGSPHVDYMIYTPRTSGTNGNFGEITVEYTLSSAPSTWVKLADRDLGMSGNASRIDFGENGIDNVNKVRVTVNSASTDSNNKFASCAEMGFYQVNAETAQLMTVYFKDALCSQLKDDVTEASANGITDPYFRQLVLNMLAGDYSTKFRVGEFEAFRPVGDLQSELRTSSAYNRYENPTGIYFEKDETLVLFVEGLGSDEASLIIKSFGPAQAGEGQPESSYPLANGMNVIKTRNRGNGYISYYTPNYATASKVKIHFAMATENGYFCPDKGHTNEDWKWILANAKSDVLDVYTQRLHVAGLLKDFKAQCPNDGLRLAALYDGTVKREWEIMGLEQNNRVPKNRQFARVVANGFMFADGIGAGIQYDSFHAIANPNSIDLWGLGHELGHNNQVAPGMKWSGCGETTNNIYAAWAQHKEGNGYHRLEDENSGIDSYSGWRGGRFQIYLEEGVRKGVSWQLQDGADYHGATPAEKTVTGEDYDGNRTGSVTTTSRNYDHFVKVVPFYQLALYTFEAGKSPETYGAVFEDVRNSYNADMQLTNGQLQIKAMKRFCDAAKINFLPFFEKAGMFKPIDAYIEDYSAGWLKINQAMLDELTEYVEGKGYPEAPAALNYINAYNWEVFRDEAKLEENTVGAGCTPFSGYVLVMHDSWKNAVGFETYDKNDNLIHISMFGLGGTQKSKNLTKVLFPSNASYIKAVGYDGTKVKCYQK